MSSFEVHTGFWTNWSHGRILGATLTLSPRDGAILLSFTAAFVALVGSQLWKIISYCWHQAIARRGQHDGLHYQQRNVLRNLASPGSAAYIFTLQAWFWRGRAAKSFLRTIPGALFATLYLIVFTLLAIFSSQVSKSAGSERIMKEQKCGFILPSVPITAATLLALDIKSARDARIADSYARACYGVTSAPPQCGILPQSQLTYAAEANTDCPFDRSICNGTAFTVRSNPIDSHLDLGINAPVDDRVQLYKEMTCAPLALQGRVAFLNPTEEEEFSGYDNNTLVKYSYGTTQAEGGLRNWTFLYNTDGRYSNVGYAVNTIQWFPGIANSAWTPIPELQVQQGDVDIVFIAFNAMTFAEPCFDPVFTARRNVTLQPVNGPVVVQYIPDRVVTPMACVTKYKICTGNGSNQRCTPGVGSGAVTEQLAPLQLSLPQTLAALRVLLAVGYTTFTNNVNTLQATALRAQEKTSLLTQLALPANQWQNEVKGWFDDSLARLQYSVREYAMIDSTTPLPQGSYLYQPWDPSTGSATWNTSALAATPAELNLWRKQCSQQRTNDAQNTISFSVLGLGIIFVLGVVILIVSITLETIVGWLQVAFKKGNYRRQAWLADNHLHLQQSLYRNLGLGEWPHEGDEAIVPTTDKSKQKFACPLDHTHTNNSDHDNETEAGFSPITPDTASYIGGDSKGRTSMSTSEGINNSSNRHHQHHNAPEVMSEKDETMVQSRPLLV